jgi:vacuolar-type H+-ATPase subunit H
MRDIVEQVLETEKRAEQVIQQARARETEIRNAVETESGRIVQQARADAQRLVLEESNRARQEADREYRQAVQQAESANAGFVERNRPKIESAVERVIALLITPDYPREE